MSVTYCVLPHLCHISHFSFFDSLLRSTIQSIANSDLSDVQWLQANLPVKDGGLGDIVCLRSHFLPFSHQRSVLCLSRRTSCLVVLLLPRHASGLLVRMVVTTRCSARHPPAETTILGPPRSPSR